MDEKDNLEQEQNSNSTPSNLPIAVKENKFKTLIEDIKDPMFSWRLREGFRDFTDAVSMSAVGQAFKRMVNSVSSTVSNFANRRKEIAENKRNNDPSKTGISVSTIEPSEIKNSIIMPQAAQKTAKEAPSSIIIAGADTQNKGTIINNSKSAKDVELEAAENGLKLEDIDVDEASISQDAEKTVAAVEDVNKTTATPTIESGEINFGQPVQEKESKDGLEK